MAKPPAQKHRVFQYFSQQEMDVLLSAKRIKEKGTNLHVWDKNNKFYNMMKNLGAISAFKDYMKQEHKKSTMPISRGMGR